VTAVEGAGDTADTADTAGTVSGMGTGSPGIERGIASAGLCGCFGACCWCCGATAGRGTCISRECEWDWWKAAATAASACWYAEIASAITAGSVPAKSPAKVTGTLASESDGNRGWKL
jgi:hypothetical protein